jgi:hypothetical protein
VTVCELLLSPSCGRKEPELTFGKLSIQNQILALVLKQWESVSVFDYGRGDSSIVQTPAPKMWTVRELLFGFNRWLSSDPAGV